MILAYHEVTPTATNIYSVSCRQLEEHLGLITSTEQMTPSRALMVTFDDGVESQFQYGLPLLEAHNAKACFFVNAGLVGQNRTIKGWTQRFMGWPELRELVSLGHSVQSHGWSHEFLTACSAKELENQLQRSRLTLEERLGIAVDSISAPGGRWNRNVLVACRRAGYANVFISDPWISAKKSEGVILRGRFMVLRTSTANSINAMLKGGRCQLASLYLRGRIKSTIRLVLGERAYHSLWRHFMRMEESEPV
jgi:peptidoglycan/xylan/chitin deacetylase (PgdA/CDA1 family)